MRIRTALILCAGFGKRLNPLTLETPKPLLKIKNTTILERNYYNQRTIVANLIEPIFI